MNTTHHHEWQCYPTDDSLLVCKDNSCGTVTKIEDLLFKAEKKGVARGRYEAYTELLDKHMLTPIGRRAVGAYVREHPIAQQQQKIIATQGRLI